MSESGFRILITFYRGDNRGMAEWNPRGALGQPQEPQNHTGREASGAAGLWTQGFCGLSCSCSGLGGCGTRDPLRLHSPPLLLSPHTSDCVLGSGTTRTHSSLSVRKGAVGGFDEKVFMRAKRSIRGDSGGEWGTKDTCNTSINK